MKIKNIVVEVKSVEDTLKEAKEVMVKIKERKFVKKKESISFSNIDIMRKVLTNKRLELIKSIKKYKPKSIYQLAKIVGRDSKSVNSDIKILSNLGMVDIKSKENGRENIVPSVEYEEIDVAIAV
jgi:predicted transcriptional regulator